MFDALDRLENYTETSSGKVTTHTFTYYPSYDRKTEKVVSNGVTLKDRSYTYNGTYWLTGITETAGTGGSITYSYDNNGNSTRKTDTTSGSTQRTLFEYNSRNQLKHVAHGAPNAEVGQGTHMRVTDKAGNQILVPKRVDLKTGEAQPGAELQKAMPDAVSFERRLIVDDKPLGRPIAKDRQEIIRFIEAFKKREGVLPETIGIQRYDPKTGVPVRTDLYKPEDFLPKK